MRPHQAAIAFVEHESSHPPLNGCATLELVPACHWTCWWAAGRDARRRGQGPGGPSVPPGVRPCFQTLV